MADPNSAPATGFVTLGVTPEKPHYLPGEPIHVDITLTRLDGATLTAGFKYYAEKLNPNLGQLYFSVRPKYSPFGYRELQQPFLHESDPNAVIATELFGSATRKGVGIWFTLTDSNHPPTGRPFWLKTDFAGFADPNLYVESQPVEVVVDEDSDCQGLYDDDAFELFVHPAAREFLFFLGGDHIPQGYKNLTKISSSYKDTIYAAYADVALGAYWARPFKGMNSIGSTITRSADPVKSKAYLDKAKAWNDAHSSRQCSFARLPPSWKAILDSTLESLQTPGGRRQ